MINFRKIAAASKGKLLLAYYREQEPGPTAEAGAGPDQGGLDPAGRQLAAGSRLTAYYAGRDRKAQWRPDMPHAVAEALGIDRRRMPTDEHMERLFEGKRADNGEAWSKGTRTISALDLTFTPHKSVSLVAEMAKSPAERALVWNAIDRAADYTMRVVAGDLGWARKGAGGADGAEPGAVGWVTFRHHSARQTLAVQDGPDGVTNLREAPMVGDPNSHIHSILFNLVATEGGHIGSLDTKQLTKTRLHYYDAIFQATLADLLREIGMRTGVHKIEKAVVLEAVPEAANTAFSKGTRQVLRSAKDYAKRQGLDWDTLPAERKERLLAASGLASRLKKNGGEGEEAAWLELAETIGWKRQSALENAKPTPMSDTERFDAAYTFVAKHLAEEFHTAAVVEHDKLRMYSAMALIGLGIKGGVNDVDRMVEIVEDRGMWLKGEHVALVTGVVDGRLRTTNTAQIRIEADLVTKAGRAARDRSGALSADVLDDVIRRSGLPKLKEEEPEAVEAQIAAIHALGQEMPAPRVVGSTTGHGAEANAPTWGRIVRHSPEAEAVVAEAARAIKAVLEA